MNPSSVRVRRIAAAILALQLAACGNSDPSDEQLLSGDAGSAHGEHGAGRDEHGSHDALVAGSETAASAGSASLEASELGSSGAPSAEQPFSLTVADLTAYVRGVHRELEMLKSAQQRLAQAQGDAEQLEILGEVLPYNLRVAGAAAAGVSEDRYAHIGGAVNEVLGKLDMSEASLQMTPSPEELAEMTPEMRAEVEEGIRQMQAAWGNPYEGLEAATAEALKGRLDELRQLRAEHLGLLVNVAR